MDRAGRIQLPEDVMDALELRGNSKLKLEIENKKLSCTHLKHRIEDHLKF